MGEPSSNPYSVYIVYDNDNRNREDFDKLLNNEAKVDDIIYINNVRTKNDNNVKKYIMCMKKDFNDSVTAKEAFAEKNNLNIKRYNPSHDNLPEGTTYGYHIQLREDFTYQNVVDLFGMFESKGMLYGGSVKFIKAPDYEDGTPRKYMIVKFEKVNGKISRQFIKKFRALLHNSEISNAPVKINWVQHSVLDDIEKGNNKPKNIKK